MRFVESPLKFLLLPLVPITAIGLVELLDASRELTSCCVVDTTTQVEEIKPAIQLPPAPPAPCKGPCGSAPPA